MYSITLLNVESIKKIIREIIIEAIITTTPLLCNSAHVGQLTLLSSSSEDSSMYVLNLDIFLFFSARVGRLPSTRFRSLRINFSSQTPYFYVSHGWRDSNSQPMVLETTTLPIELHPCGFLKVKKRYHTKA